MESSSLGLPDRATSEGLSPPSRNSMEDADSSATRKRPRLDSGDRARRSMSADHVRPAPSAATSPHVLSDSSSQENTMTDDTTPNQESMPIHPFNQTPSKVTINVRDSTLDGSPPPTPSNGTAPEATLNNDIPRSSNRATPSTVGDAASSRVASITSSPAQSPEIEVAEVEDLDEDMGYTKWRPLGRAVDAADIQASLLDSFPLADPSQSLQHTIMMISQTLQKGSVDDLAILRCLAEWVNSYLEQTSQYASQWRSTLSDFRSFWEEFPSIMEGLLKRNVRLGAGPVNYMENSDMKGYRQCIQDFLVAFTALTARFLQLDCQSLVMSGNETNDKFEPISTPYLVCFNWMLMPNEELPLWRLLKEIYRCDCRFMVSVAVERFLYSSHGFKYLKEYTILSLERFQSLPALAHNIIQALSISRGLIKLYNGLHLRDDHTQESLSPLLKTFLSQSLDLFQAVDIAFQKLVKKQASCLPGDTCTLFVKALSSLYQQILIADKHLAESQIPKDCPSVEDIESQDVPLMLELMWKFHVLKKCIMEGRMEIRVKGVDTMALELVEVYRTYVDSPKGSTSHPIVQYLADFLLENKLIPYLVGVDSHSQLIIRSSNIVGFLVVTHRYTEAETDVIWNAIGSSQDANQVNAILDMVTGYLNLSHYSTLLYLCKALNELPVQAFDTRMIIFGKEMLSFLRKKYQSQRSSEALDMHPYNLCIRLIRETTSQNSLSPARNKEVYHFAYHELQNLLPYGPSDTDRSSIYEECINNISSKSPVATGSVAALNIILGPNPGQSIRDLVNESDLISLIVEDYVRVVEIGPGESAISQISPLPVRLNLLQQIIVHVPDSVTPELGQILWNYVVGSKAPSGDARDVGWSMLVRVLQSSSGKNSFLDQCISTHLPGLDSRFFTQGIVPFSQQALHYEENRARAADSSECQDIESPVSELLWHLSLVAPNDTIEARVIYMFVTFYLDSSSIQRAPRDVVNATHIALVERCIRQLTKAAFKLKNYNDGTSSGEDESMVIVASDEDVRVERLSFSRSLLVLKDFLRGIRSRPRYTPVPQSSPTLPQNSTGNRGEIVKIQYQSFNGGASTGIHSLEIGDLETVEDLAKRLSKLTGFCSFTVIAGGQKLDVVDVEFLNTTLRDLKIDQKGLLLVKKAQDAETFHPIDTNVGLRSLEVEVMKHFPELYNLLGMEDEMGKDVYDFLITFPPHESITEKVCSQDVSIQTTFPRGAPSKVLYSVYTLRKALEVKMQEGTATEGFKAHGVQTLATALITIASADQRDVMQMDMAVVASLIDCLLSFLKEPMPCDISSTYFSDAKALVDLLIQVVFTVETLNTTSENISLVQNSFSTVLEASLHSKDVWTYFTDHPETIRLLCDLLLGCPTSQIRAGVIDAIHGVCIILPTPTNTSSHEFVSFFWGKFVTMIPRAVMKGSISQQFFDIALTVFKSMDKFAVDALPLGAYVQDWSKLLLEHVHDEFIGRDNVDWVVFGLSRLLLWCLQLIKSRNGIVNRGNNLMGAFFRTHLFPEVLESEGNAIKETCIPILHSPTRDALYSIVLSLCNGLSDYQWLLGLTKELLPQGEDSNAWMWGIAQASEEYHYEPNWNFERHKAIRSPVGYPGLRNLSNTCYLNSLFTQLFMNVGFRAFMLEQNIPDGNSSQRLLSETKKLFGYMQETWLKSVDPQGITDSVITYENSLIDISVQMDVDEFYNLLFDRWESQILSAGAKKRFRNFYGGQIVQQIKSKECPHISERLEPFSAIQCEIKGKSSLIESLNAYTGGEIMEGDNKYSCTSCGCYVDAVKRACLRDIPDNLIFHLKRFDYDLMTGQRHKINDHFEFPQEIDMAPFHVDHLKDPEAPNEQDMFNLVGILVHSGTAESGHYYSYIRERPVHPAQHFDWVEFNDADVLRFDPRHIPDQCYGGTTEDPQFPQMRFPKGWNAYMLFYERVSEMEAEHLRYSPIAVDVPVKDRIPEDLKVGIAVENQAWIRKYCLFDPAHAKFAKSFLEQLPRLSKGDCSDDHGVEKEALWLALEYLEQILSRTKDNPDFHVMLKTIQDVIGTCADCSKLALDWVVQHENALRNLLLRSPSWRVRRDFAGMIVGSLKILREHQPRLYGFETDDFALEPNNVVIPEVPGSFQDIVKELKDLFLVLPMHSRSWDDYFGLLGELANLGFSEVHVLLREGFLRRCLEILIVEHPGTKRLKAENQHYVQYIRLLEKGRKYSHRLLIELMRILLDSIDLELEPQSNTFNDRSPTNGRLPLTKVEDDFMRYGVEAVRPKNIVFLDKVLAPDENREAAQRILRLMVQAEPCAGLLAPIARTIFTGVNIDPASQAMPYLHAALTFCEFCPQPLEARQVIAQISNEVDTIGTTGGEEHLQFFVDARRIQNLRLSSKGPQLFHRMVLINVPSWAPPLLMYWDYKVRADTITLLKTLVFDHDIDTMDDGEKADEIATIGKNLARVCAKRLNESSVKPRKPLDARNLEQIVDVVKHCIGTYYHPDAAESDRHDIESMEDILDHLQPLLVTDADDALSDSAWNNDSDLPTDSESDAQVLSPWAG